MKIRFSILLLIFLNLSAQVFSQTAKNLVLRGQLLKSDGKTLPYTELELVPIESNKIVINTHLISTSNSLGRFTFSDVPDGKYTLSINFDDKPTDLSPYPTFFYPNTEQRAEAEIFEVKNKNLAKTIIFRLRPALIQRRITGKVILKTGAPVQGAYLFIRDIYFDKSFAIGNIMSGRNGEFSVRGFEGRKYQMGAMLFLKNNNSPPYNFGNLIAAVETDIFELSSKDISLTLVLGNEAGFERLPNKYIGQLIIRNETFQNQKY